MEEEDEFQDLYDEADEKYVQAAIKIQSVYRGFSYRHDQSLKETHQYNAKVIQKAWRAYVDRCKIRRVIEILALFRINRAVSHFRLRVHHRKIRYKLQQFDELMTFFPAKTKAPLPRPKYRPRRGKGKGKGPKMAQTVDDYKSTKKKKAEQDNNSKTTGLVARGGRPLNRASMSGSGPIRTKVARTTAGPPRKRKVLVPMPPPWHDKDPKRLSQAQQDDLLYNQKQNIDWVKKELLPMLLRECSPLLGERDELTSKNEKYQERLVPKAFICPIPRGMKSLGLKAPKAISFVGDGLVTVVATSTGAIVMEPKSLAADNVVYNYNFAIDAPLLDVAVHPSSGQIVGIDSHWVLRLFDQGRTIVSYNLNPDINVPKASKFLNFDKFGLLWVNLFMQKGPLLLIDPITMQPSLQINLDNVAQQFRFIRTVVSMTPLYLNDRPFGFAGVFSSLSEVFIFTYDFSKSRKLSHPKMKGFPTVKQANQRVFIWSSDCIIYVYELKDFMEGITMIKAFKMKSPPTDICATSEPDLIYISCEDCTIHVLLGKTTEFPLRLSTNRMERSELQFCEVLLGPITYTKSRKAFREMTSHKFTEVPKKIAAFAFSEKMSLVSAVFDSGNISSVWMVNDSQNVKCIEFDAFNYCSPAMSQSVASANFNENVSNYTKKRADFFEALEYFSKFDVHANQGLMSNMFNPKAKKFNMGKYFFTVDAHLLYPFLPEYEFPLRYISSYELYQFLTRMHLLPAPSSSFPGFLEKYAPQEVQRPLPNIDLVMNPKLPVRTQSYYSAIANVKFDLAHVQEILNSLDPLDKLNDQLTKFTISGVFLEDDMKISRPRLWLSTLEIKELNRRLSYLSMLEDLVKTELMNRVQSDIDQTFRKNQLTKMQPVSSIDIHQHAPRNDAKSIPFSRQPNRNPLLDEKRHKCIYDTWSNNALFGRDDTLQMNVRALHIPSDIFNSKPVAAQFDLVRRVSNASKHVSSIVHSFNEDFSNNTEIVVVTEDSRALPLSHYLTIHSFLGGTSRLISAVRSIFSRLLVALYQFHKSGIIVRTVYPDNILLNAADLSVTFGNVYDCQQLMINGHPIYLPLPKDFAHYSNPFLPPEYFHEPPRKYTTAFDIWQFGMTLLYVITGFLPVSYGTKLMKHIDDDWRRPNEQHVRINVSNPLDDPEIYPRPIFFYDWMKGGPLVSEKERCTGERGECFFSTPNPGSSPTILNLNQYKLLPCKNTKVNYDESRVFIDIIASCLQVDPEKRPTVEELLKTYAFNQTSQISEIMDNYMRTPDPNVFVAQFFTPVLNHLTEETFHYAIGIVSSLLFFENPIEDDSAYAFPLDSKATEKVITSLFEVKFVEKLVDFVLKSIDRTITVNDVNPTITYENECFDGLHKFFNRFVSSVEKGSGPLIGYVDEVIMSLLGLYAGTPHLRYNSVVLKASGHDFSHQITRDNAALYVYVHQKLHGLVKFSLDASPFIIKSLKRFPEHNDAYFDNFLSISDAVYSFAHSLCCTVETQRANAIKTMASIFQNGQSLSVVRMFLDFRVVQKVAHCFYMPSVRNDACSFICSCFRAIRMKSYDPTYYMLQSAINVPTILLHCASGIKVGGNESIKLPSIEIIRNVLFGDSLNAIINLVYDDIIFTIADNSKDTLFHNLLKDAIGYASVFVQHIITASPVLLKTMSLNGMDFVPEFDPKSISETTTDINEILPLAKKLAAVLFTRQTAMTQITSFPVSSGSTVLIQIINITIKECENMARMLDTQAYKPRPPDAPPISLRSKSKAKEQSFQAAQDTVNEMCEVIFLLFRILCYFWRKNEYPVPKDLMDYLKELLFRTPPYCRTMLHPVNQVYYIVQLIFVYIFSHMPNDNQIFQHLKDFGNLWAEVMHQGISFVFQSSDKETAILQLFAKYPLDRRVRERMLMPLIKQRSDLLPIFKVIISEMLWNKTELKWDFSCYLNERYRFPLRSEAMKFVLKILRLRELYEQPARLLARELVQANFLENEKHLVELDDNFFFVKTSIDFLRVVMQCQTLFSESIRKETKVQLDSLEVRFSRQLNPQIIRKDKSKPRSNIPAPKLRESWQRPLSALPKKASSPYGSYNGPIKTARPVTAFASTRKRLTPRLLTPR